MMENKYLKVTEIRRSGEVYPVLAEARDTNDYDDVVDLTPYLKEIIIVRASDAKIVGINLIFNDNTSLNLLDQVEMR